MSPADQPVVLSRVLSVTLFQCARELVYNLIKHADASQGSIELAWDDASVTLVVADDGVGLARSAPPADGDAPDYRHTDGTAPPQRPLSAVDSVATGGFGLYSIRERVALLDGTLSIDSGPRGTRARILLPRRAAAGSSA
ncbi:sensor histidine kinase [Thiohalocapsa halophila]|nr:ATP-binding protein [Thiohalocapsa halophila]